MNKLTINTQDFNASFIRELIASGVTFTATVLPYGVVEITFTGGF